MGLFCVISQTQPKWFKVYSWSKFYRYSIFILITNTLLENTGCLLLLYTAKKHPARSYKTAALCASFPSSNIDYNTLANASAKIIKQTDGNKSIAYAKRNYIGLTFKKMLIIFETYKRLHTFDNFEGISINFSIVQHIS